ncbi:MAG: hypothetical protein H6684_10655 [Deltaproteobacteria bacterium]|nr:hypothetical protein [bacterium]MCB9489180.1 hypothetical protein [Deltaproteobacteria bacterium]
MGVRPAWVSAACALVVLLTVGPAFALGPMVGHGPDEPWTGGTDPVSGAMSTRTIKPRLEYQFHIVPKNASEPDKAVIKIGDEKKTRDDFFAFIRNVGGYQLKRESLQRTFQIRFWLFEELTRRNPENVNKTMKGYVGLPPDSPKMTTEFPQWVVAEADHHARLTLMAAKAKANPDINKSDTAEVIECMAMHIKMDFLQDLVMFGPMEPTVEGLRQFVAELSPEQRANIEDELLQDPDKATEKTRRLRRMRWIQYRQDLFEKTPYDLKVGEIETVGGLPNSTLLLKVNDHEITLGEFLAIHGPIYNEVYWRNSKFARINQIRTAYTIGDEVDRLDILPRRYRQKVTTTELIFLAAEEIIREYGAQVLPPEKDGMNFLYFRSILKSPTRQELVKLFLEKVDATPEYQARWIDRDYLSSLRWRVSNAYTPP